MLAIFGLCPGVPQDTNAWDRPSAGRSRLMLPLFRRDCDQLSPPSWVICCLRSQIKSLVTIPPLHMQMQLEFWKSANFPILGSPTLLFGACKTHVERWFVLPTLRLDPEFTFMSWDLCENSHSHYYAPLIRDFEVQCKYSKRFAS